MSEQGEVSFVHRLLVCKSMLVTSHRKNSRFLEGESLLAGKNMPVLKRQGQEAVEMQKLAGHEPQEQQ
eukprot:503612-Pelagomonas_calceolata.AAC.4